MCELPTIVVGRRNVYIQDRLSYCIFRLYISWNRYNDLKEKNNIEVSFIAEYIYPW